VPKFNSLQLLSQTSLFHKQGSKVENQAVSKIANDVCGK